MVGAADGGFVGNWDILSNGNTERWIGHPDGTVEVIGQKWDVIWGILDDGTLEIRWGDKKPYKMKRDDEGWSGKASFGNPVKFTPGDW